LKLEIWVAEDYFSVLYKTPPKGKTPQPGHNHPP